MAKMKTNNHAVEIEILEDELQASTMSDAEHRKHVHKLDSARACKAKPEAAALLAELKKKKAAAELEIKQIKKSLNNNSASDGIAITNVISGMERTTLSVLALGIMTSVIGATFMSIDLAAEVPMGAGQGMVSLGLAMCAVTLVFHAYRLVRLRKGHGITACDSLVYMGIVASIIVLALGFEIYFAVIYPYLERSKNVKVIDDNSLSM